MLLLALLLPAPPLCDTCGEQARKCVEIRQEACVVFDPLTQTCERTYRTVGRSWRCWRHNSPSVLPASEADLRVSEAVMSKYGFRWER